MGLAINVDISGFTGDVEPELAHSEQQVLNELETDGGTVDVRKADAGT